VALFVAGWVSGWLAETPNQRARAWIAGIGGAALLGACLSPSQSKAAFAAAGMLLVLAGTIGQDLLQGRLGSRLSAAFAVLLTVGLQGLVGAVLFGVLVPRGEASPLGWVAVVGMGFLASTFLMDAFRPRSAAEPQATVALASVAAALIVLLGMILYARLRGLVSPPVIVAAPAALAVSFATVLLWGRIPAGRRARMARALRWPVSPASSTRVEAVVAPVEAFVRGGRDVLEGDASLLWALVVVVVALLLLQGSA
jgi:hypothetical protein